MAVTGKREYLSKIQNFFPLKDVESVKKLFANELDSPDPNLAILSLVCGFMEHQLTDKSFLKKNADFVVGMRDKGFPVLQFTDFREMYETYLTLVDQTFHHVLEPSKVGNTTEHQQKISTSREKVKAVADFVWSQLSTAYFKDRPHIQSVYSFLYGKRLDCFGVALLVVASAQCIGINDVHLVLSEDHAWVSFGDDNKETAEVTWHGKRDAIKRGSPISQNSLVEFSKSWLYLGGNGMQCDRHMEVAAVVSAINPGINAGTDSEILGQIQQALLWLMFDSGHLERYPMAVCNLADLEEIERTRPTFTIDDLYESAIGIAKREYGGCHVYPFTYYGGYLFRRGEYANATARWKEAALAAGRYTHSREDEELYKEFNEIANTFFPQIAKYCKNVGTVGKGAAPESEYFNSNENFANILTFFDGVCLWEQGGSTTLVHSEWAKNFLKLVNSFSFEVRKNYLMSDSYKESSQSTFPQSEKMKLMQDSLCQEKINSNIINLHLTSRVGLLADAKQSAKRGSGMFPVAKTPWNEAVFVRKRDASPTRYKQRRLLQGERQ